MLATLCSCADGVLLIYIYVETMEPWDVGKICGDEMNNNEKFPDTQCQRQMMSD